jgi:hypothetical protein
MKNNLIPKLIVTNMISLCMLGVSVMYVAASLCSLHIQGPDFYMQMLTDKTSTTDMLPLARSAIQVVSNNFKAAIAMSSLALVVLVVEIVFALIIRDGLRAIRRASANK